MGYHDTMHGKEAVESFGGRNSDRLIGASAISLLAIGTVVYHLIEG